MLFRSEALSAGREFGISVIPGIELSSEMPEGTGVHILGYGIDHRNSELLSVCGELKKKRARRNRELLKVLAELGWPVTDNDLLFRRGQDYVGKPMIARALAGKGYIEDPRDAFKDGGIFTMSPVRKVKKGKISAEKAVRLILNAGGMPVLAHPGKIRGIGEKESQTFFDNVERIITVLSGFGLKGMECRYSQHSDAEVRAFLNIARKHRLIVTSGSDFHGPELSDIREK